LFLPAFGDCSSKIFLLVFLESSSDPSLLLRPQLSRQAALIVLVDCASLDHMAWRVCATKREIAMIFMCKRARVRLRVYLRKHAFLKFLLNSKTKKVPSKL
jgi:hypothetical protein